MHRPMRSGTCYPCIPRRIAQAIRAMKRGPWKWPFRASNGDTSTSVTGTNDSAPVASSPICGASIRISAPGTLRPPGTVAEALEYLRVPEMRRLAIELGVMPSKPRPRKRTEFVALLKHTDVPAPILDAAMVRFGEQMQARRDRMERARYDLLAHTLTMRVYKLRKMADWSRLRPHEPGCRLRAMQSHCPIESEYVAKFNAGELIGPPAVLPRRQDRPRSRVARPSREIMTPASRTPVP